MKLFGELKALCDQLCEVPKYCLRDQYGDSFVTELKPLTVHLKQKRQTNTDFSAVVKKLDEFV